MAGEALLVLFALALAIAIPLWVYSDAKQNSPHSAVLWALVALFGGLLGLILYLILGRKTGGGRRNHGTY